METMTTAWYIIDGRGTFDYSSSSFSFPSSTGLAFLALDEDGFAGFAGFAFLVDEAGLSARYTGSSI